MYKMCSRPTHPVHVRVCSLEEGSCQWKERAVDMLVKYK